MVLSNENDASLAKPTNIQGGGRKFGMELRNNRRALGVINQKIVGGHQYPCVVNKKGSSETNGVGVKNPPAALNRPITRKFAAQIASSKQPSNENGVEQESKKPKTTTNDFSVWEDLPLTNVEENEVVKDQPVPMSLEQTETNEKDQMEEVEMEDIFEESVMDIDSCDAKNPLAVVDYVDDLYAFYKKIEGSGCVSPNYMEQQVDINERMRSILIDWLIEVHYKFDLREETLFLTVNIIDRFLAKQAVVRKKLQLVGLVAMLLACKYEEVSIPIVDDLVFISDKAYSRKEVLDMERLMLSTLQFNMTVPTAFVFMRRFLKAAQSDKKLELLSFFLMELCFVEYEMLKFPPSFLAAAAIYTAQCAIYGVGQWSKTCEWHTSYTEDQLLECSKLIVSFHQKAATGKLTGVHRKYSTSRFGYAAKCEPAHFLVQAAQQQQQ